MTSPRGSNPRAAASSNSSSPNPSPRASPRREQHYWMADDADAVLLAPLDLDRQSIAAYRATETSSPVFRDAQWGPLHIVARLREDCTTLWTSFLRSVTMCPRRQCLATRFLSYKETPEGKRFVAARGKYEWKTYAQVHEEVLHVANALESMGVVAGKGIGLCLKNCREYSVMELASYALGCYNATVYESFNVENIRHCLAHSDVSTLLCSWENVESIMDTMGTLPAIEIVVCVGRIPPSVERLWKSWAVRGARSLLLTYEDLVLRGARVSPRMLSYRGPKADDMACIMYTSGTTGNSKGVVLKHSNFIATVSGCILRTPIRADDRYISFLPLAHVLERMSVSFFCLFFVCFPFDIFPGRSFIQS